MKKADMSVTMPMTSYEELSAYRQRLERLQSELRECLDTKQLENGVSNTVFFNVGKAVEIARRFLPFAFKDAGVVVEASQIH